MSAAVAVAYGANVGSASRAHGTGIKHPRVAPRLAATDVNSFCMTCAHWHFGSNVPRCERCHSAIFWWVRDSELRLFEKHPHLAW